MNITLWLLACALITQAQMVTIPDQALANWFRNNGYKKCMKGNELNVSSREVLNTQAITILADLYDTTTIIHSLEGIQYFKNLKFLYLRDHNILNIATLPNGLEVLKCNMCSVLKLSLPDSIVNVDCSDNYGLSELEYAGNKMRYLNCAGTMLHELNQLPDSMYYLNCRSMGLLQSIRLPKYLYSLDCSYTAIDTFQSLPVNLSSFRYDGGGLVYLPELPKTLKTLFCSGRQLKLPILPIGLRHLMFSTDKIDTIGNLPDSLLTLVCRPAFNSQSAFTFEYEMKRFAYELNIDMNQLFDAIGSSDHVAIIDSVEKLVDNWAGENEIKMQYKFAIERLREEATTGLKAITSLPGGLQYLDCANNVLVSLPDLPKSLKYLYCGGNNLTSLPDLPESLIELFCDHNRLERIKHLPDGLKVLYTPGSGLKSLPPNNCEFDESWYRENLPIEGE